MTSTAPFQNKALGEGVSRTFGITEPTDLLFSLLSCQRRYIYNYIYCLQIFLDDYYHVHNRRLCNHYCYLLWGSVDGGEECSIVVDASPSPMATGRRVFGYKARPKRGLGGPQRRVHRVLWKGTRLENRI